ncbi:MAG: pitrilysin family protein [Candidatus Delongbacteria bacterium]
MKKIIFTILCFTALLTAQDILNKTLPNGLEVVVKKNTSNSSVGFFMFVKTGSIHENEYIGKGLSHYLEHIVSGGSTKNHSEEWHQNKRKEIGAITNAYTTFGATVYYMQADKEYLDDCLYLLSDNIMNCSFDKKELEREKDVIIKEFVYRVASPSAKLYNRMRYNTFLTSNVRNEVIGDIELFKQTTRDEMIDYYNRRYVPNNMILVATGDLNPKETMKKIEETYKDWEAGVLTPVYLPQERIRSGNIKYVEEFAIQQPRAIITKLIPKSDQADFPAITMVANILFDKRNSPVQYTLVEEEKAVNWIYGYFNEGAGFPEPMIQVVYETRSSKELHNVQKRLDEIIAETSKKGISQKQIDEVINREKAQKILRTPALDNDAQNIGWNMMLYGVPDSHDIRMAQYEKLTPEDVNDVLRKYFVADDRVIFYGVPEGQKEIVVEDNKEIVKTDVEKIDISDELTLLYRHNTSAPVIRGQIFLPISSDYETPENAGSFGFLVDLMFSGGTDRYSSLDLTSWIEDHAIMLRSDINNNGMNISFKCLKDDYNELTKRIFSILNEPVFEMKEIELAKERKDAAYKRSLSNPQSNYDEFRSSVLYEGQKAGLTSKERNDIIQEISQNDLKKLYKKYIRSESAIVTLFGDLNREKAVKYSREIKKNIPSGTIKGNKIPLQVPRIDDTFVNENEFEQVNVVFNFPAPTQNDDDFYAMIALNQVMANGFSGRLANATRVRNDLSYATYSYYAYAEDYGFWRISSQTSLANTERLVDVLKNEVERLIEGDITQEEILLSVESYSKMLDSYFTDNQLVGTVTRYESTGLGYNFLKDSLDELKKITPKDIKTVAEKYLTDAAVIISKPSMDVKRVVE